MNRHSPIPLWLALCVGVVFLAGVYVFAQRTVAPPQVSVIVKQPMLLPKPSASPTSVASVVTPSSSATLVPSESALPVPTDWRTYRNTTYGYEIRYPQGWTVSSRGEGDLRDATEDDSFIIIRPSTEFDGIGLAIYEFGSQEIGAVYRNAMDLASYVGILKREMGHRLTFVHNSNIDGRQANWFLVCLSPYDPSAGCIQRVYLQNQAYLYEIDGSSSVATSTTQQVIGSLHFLEKKAD